MKSRNLVAPLLPLLVMVALSSSCGSDSSRANADATDVDTTDAGSTDAGSIDAAVSECPSECLPPENAVLDCPAGECDFACDEGWHRVAQACLPDPATCPPGEAGQPIPIPSVDAAFQTRSILGLALSNNTLGVTFSENSAFAYLASFDFPSLAHVANSDRYSTSAQFAFHPAMRATPLGFISTYRRFSTDDGALVQAVLHDSTGTVLSEKNLGAPHSFLGFAESAQGIGLLYGFGFGIPASLHRNDHSFERLDAYRTELDFQGFRQHRSVAHSPAASGYRVLGQLFQGQLATAFVSDTGVPNPVVEAFDVLPGGIATLDRTDGPFISGLENGYAVLVRTATVGVFPRVRQWRLGFLNIDGETMEPLQNIEAAEDVSRVLLASGPDTVAIAYMTSDADLFVKTFSNRGVLLDTLRISSGLVDLSSEFHLAWTGDRYTIAYAQKGSGSHRMFVRTVCTPS